MSVHRNRTVLIASDNLLSIWSTVAPTCDVLAVPQEDATAALEIIRRQQPTMVVLEEAFALSARAAALVAHLQTDPQFRGVEIRLLTAESVAALQSAHATNKYTQMSLATLARPLPRHAARVRPTRPVEILVDENPATLVNLSTSGTQVCSSSVLRPQQHVRVSFPLDSGPIRTKGVVVWSAFEVAATPTYRAGIKLITALPLAVEEILSELAVR